MGSKCNKKKCQKDKKCSCDNQGFEPAGAACCIALAVIIFFGVIVFYGVTGFRARNATYLPASIPLIPQIPVIRPTISHTPVFVNPPSCAHSKRIVAPVNLIQPVEPISENIVLVSADNDWKSSITAFCGQHFQWVFSLVLIVGGLVIFLTTLVKAFRRVRDWYHTRRCNKAVVVEAKPQECVVPTSSVAAVEIPKPLCSVCPSECPCHAAKPTTAGNVAVEIVSAK